MLTEALFCTQFLSSPTFKLSASSVVDPLEISLDLPSTLNHSSLESPPLVSGSPLFQYIPGAKLTLLCKDIQRLSFHFDVPQALGPLCSNKSFLTLPLPLSRVLTPGPNPRPSSQQAGTAPLSTPSLCLCSWYPPPGIHPSSLRLPSFPVPPHQEAISFFSRSQGFLFSTTTASILQGSLKCFVQLPSIYPWILILFSI